MSRTYRTYTTPEGDASATKSSLDHGIWDVYATPTDHVVGTTDVVVGEVYRNDAGFAHRQWESSDGQQYATLTDAVHAMIHEAAARKALRLHVEASTTDALDASSDEASYQTLRSLSYGTSRKVVHLTDEALDDDAVVLSAKALCGRTLRTPLVDGVRDVADCERCLALAKAEAEADEPDVATLDEDEVLDAPMLRDEPTTEQDRLSFVLSLIDPVLAGYVPVVDGSWNVATVAYQRSTEDRLVMLRDRIGARLLALGAQQPTGHALLGNRTDEAGDLI